MVKYMIQNYNDFVDVLLEAGFNRFTECLERIKVELNPDLDEHVIVHKGNYCPDSVDISYTAHYNDNIMHKRR